MDNIHNKPIIKKEINAYHEMSPCLRFALLVDMTGQLRKKRGRVGLKEYVVVMSTGAKRSGDIPC
ncbi:MAG: hypothetical protein LBU22_08315 [Dysgonamonadaceae bacterium]|jgi:hypothetical protein|nr:hypothetical protein [Dysgonamonadaceae bacterium]